METVCLDSIQLNTRLVFQSLYIDQKKKKSESAHMCVMQKCAGLLFLVITSLLLKPRVPLMPPVQIKVVFFSVWFQMMLADVYIYVNELSRNVSHVTQSAL